MPSGGRTGTDAHFAAPSGACAPGSRRSGRLSPSFPDSYAELLSRTLPSLCATVEDTVRKLFFWKLRQRELRRGERTVLMGVLNVTPDSFSDGGKYSDPDRAFARAVELEEQGADIIDVGAESTRPGSARISAAEEMRRLIPVLKRLKGRLGVPISVDTYKPEIAERAIELGAEIINDPSGFTFEPQMARVISNHDAGVVLNHMRGRPATWAKLGPMPDPMGRI